MLDQYLEGLLEDLRRSAEGEKLTQLTLTAEPIEIDPDRAVAVGIIVNELVINAVKYAYPDGSGPIHVELSRAADQVVISVIDQGIGLVGDARARVDRHGPAHRRSHGDEARRRHQARPAAPTGTRVTVTLPFKRETKAPKQSAA